MKNLFFVLPLLLSVLFNPACRSSPGPSDTVESFYRNICDGNFDEAAKHLSSKTRSHQDEVLVPFEQTSSACKNGGGYKGLDARGNYVEDKVADVGGNVLFNDGSREFLRMKLVYESGSWKIALEPKK